MAWNAVPSGKHCCCEVSGLLGAGFVMMLTWVWLQGSLLELTVSTELRAPTGCGGLRARLRLFRRCASRAFGRCAPSCLLGPSRAFGVVLKDLRLVFRSSAFLSF